MSSSSEIILSNQVHPGDSSTETITGVKFKGDGYYSRSDGLHTVQYNIVGFIGKIVIQATLASDPVTADWFTLPSTQLTATTNTTGSYIYNFTGNYVWVRVIISDWTDGSVSSILLNH